MTLAQYLKSNDLSAREFAKRIGVVESTVGRYLSGTRLPNREILRRIVIETEGAVTANDFFSLNESPSSEPSVAA